MRQPLRGKNPRERNCSGEFAIWRLKSKRRGRKGGSGFWREVQGDQGRSSAEVAGEKSWEPSTDVVDDRTLGTFTTSISVEKMGGRRTAGGKEKTSRFR